MDLHCVHMSFCQKHLVRICYVNVLKFRTPIVGSYFTSLSTLSINAVAYTQYNLNGSNTDGSFTVDDSNSFFSPYKILPVAQENKYLGFFFVFSYFIMELYVVCTH